MIDSQNDHKLGWKIVKQSKTHKCAKAKEDKKHKHTKRSKTYLYQERLLRVTYCCSSQIAFSFFLENLVAQLKGLQEVSELMLLDKFQCTQCYRGSKGVEIFPSAQTDPQRILYSLSLITKHLSRIESKIDTDCWMQNLRWNAPTRHFLQQHTEKLYMDNRCLNYPCTVSPHFFSYNVDWEAKKSYRIVHFLGCFAQPDERLMASWCSTLYLQVWVRSCCLEVA